MKKKVIVLATSFLDELITHPWDEGKAKHVVVVIADLEKYDRDLLSQVSKKAGGSLELVSRYGIEYSSVDLDGATEFVVMVTNAPGCNALPTAEWSVSTIMGVAGRQILQYQIASKGENRKAL